MIGIYKITNNIDGKSYYGSSKNIRKRWLKHKNELNKNKHINILLQRAWNKYGEDNFIFSVVEECDVENLLIIEQKYLDLNPEYNIGKKSNGGDNLSNNPKKNEIIEKIRTSLHKTFDLMSNEEKKTKFSKPMELNPNWKGGTSKNYCKCGKEISPINKTCFECRDRKEKNNPFYNKNHSKETKDHLSKIRKGTYNGDQNIPIVINDIEYRSSGEASKVLGIPMVTIRWRVLSKNKKFENYKYK